MNRKKTKGKRHQGTLFKRVLGVVLLLIMIMLGAWYAFKHVTYDYVQVVENYTSESTNDGSYVQYAGGVLEYSRDGIALLTEKGEELWNQACQMSSPIVELCKDSAIVADKNGTSIYVFQKNGLKGEIQTTKPIEKVAVSAQGIVAAILQDEETPRVMCYDAKGNVLVEQKASLTNTGYPVDLAISQNGETLLVSYLYTKGNGIATRVCFYNFGEAGEAKKDHLVVEKEYADTVVPTTAFLGQDTSLLVTDHSLVFFKGADEPRENAVVELEGEIKSVAYNEEYVALVLEKPSKSGYRLCLYRTTGKQVLDVKIEGEYTNIKVTEGQILLYDDNKCAIYNDMGVCKFEGTLEMNVMELFPITGINKYMLISASGFQEIQLAK